VRELDLVVIRLYVNDEDAILVAKVARMFMANEVNANEVKWCVSLYRGFLT
jgi:hypothetical protein